MEQVAAAEEAQRKAFSSKTNGGDDGDDMEYPEEDKALTQTKLVNESEDIDPEAVAKLKSVSEAFGRVS